MSAWQSANKTTDAYHAENKGLGIFSHLVNLDLAQKKVKKTA